jgi:PQQ-dependent catabolism-associated CXXCW motif protein
MRVRTAGVILCGALALAGVAARGEGETAFEPEQYRTEDYRAPTPATLRGARVITTAEAQALWRAGTAVFVDVMPQVARPANLPAGTLWREQRRLNIPGSLWLPDTGYGELSRAADTYLTSALERATGGDRAKVLVIYCLRDCWMSWNAAKRAISLGYAGVMWYPEGTDGWQDAGLPLSEANPAPRERE